MHSIHYNRSRRSLILIKIDASEATVLLPVELTLESVMRKAVHEQQPLFSDQNIRSPGFIEFEHVTQHILTFCSDPKLYRLYDMASYHLLFTICDPTIKDIKMYPSGVIIYIHDSMGGSAQQTFTIVSMATGQVLAIDVCSGFVSEPLLLL
jgi:hypothetical protein